MTDLAARVGAVIVDYHAGALLAECVDSLVANGVTDVVVVNNAALGTSDLHLDGRPVTLVEPGVNLGYGGGVNRGAAHSHRELLLVTNPDVTFHEGAVAALVACLDDRPEVGIAGPTILTEEGEPYPSLRVFPSVGLAAAHALLSPIAPQNRWSRRYRSPGADGRVDWVSGACLLIRRELFERLGGFDERYFMFAEEMDLCWRARELGSTCAGAAGAVVTHVEGASRRLAPRAMTLAHHRSALRFEWRTARGARRLLAPLASVVLLLRLALVSMRREGP